MLLADAVTSSAAGARLAFVPVGSIEQHGPHLPLDTATDTAIATAAVSAAGDKLGAWVALALSYGSSGEHQSFAGTSSIGTDILRLTVLELVRSMRTWVDRVLFVNGHGGNLRPSTAPSASSRSRATTSTGSRARPRSALTEGYTPDAPRPL